MRHPKSCAVAVARILSGGYTNHPPQPGLQAMAQWVTYLWRIIDDFRLIEKADSASETSGPQSAIPFFMNASAF